MRLVFSLNFSESLKKEFQDIQWKAREVAYKLNPNSEFGFNINSTYQNEIYPEKDTTDKSKWNSYDLNWSNFISLFPEYKKFCEKYNFYLGCTMISRPIEWAHRHGNGQYTLTYPLLHCDGINVCLLTPKNIDEINEKNIHWLTNGEDYAVDYTYRCITDTPFMLKANHFHKTYDKHFLNGKTIFSVWHENSVPTTESDLINLQKRFENELDI